MSEAVNMEATLAQENIQIGKGKSPRKTTSELNHEIGSQSACSEALEQKDEIKEQNGPMEAKAKSDYGIAGKIGVFPEDSTGSLSCEQSRPPPEDATINSSYEQFESPPLDAISKSSMPEHVKLELNSEFSSVGVHCEQLEHKHNVGPENVQNAPSETKMVESMTPSQGQSVSVLEDAKIDSNPEQLGPLPYGASDNPGRQILRTPPDDEAKNPRRLGHGGKRTSARKGKLALKPSVECTRVLRSRSQEKSKAPELSNTLVDHGAREEKKRKKRKRKHMKAPVNEFLKIRNHLRYLLNRMNYEKNLIDAYSGEGWKGLSLEKVKLEKELERAKSEILRRKLKIRDLFQRLDLSCAEGRFPESLFDSEGLIDCEDIFCAKCGSKDLPVDNDIILCDGACERGFHQFCLQPPLLKDDIPPGDEGWLCPGCDCKADCIKLLNEWQGTNISITDTWEKVFPEAAAGNKLDESFGLPSDDSEDDDYNPSGSEVDEKVQGDELSSDESDFSSASDDLGASLNNDQYLGLPSDDSEDDDYDPNAQDLDEPVKQENSSSDFTSDSEDFSSAFDDKRSSGKDKGPISLLSDHHRSAGDSDEKRSKPGGAKLQSLSVELLSLLESNPGHSAATSRKRDVERLDYKKLHDETYRNVSSDSSDEDWTDAAAPKKRKSINGKVIMVSPKGETPAVRHSADAEDMSHSQKESELTPKRRGRKKLVVEDAIESPAQSHKGSPKPGSSGKSTKKSASKRLGEAVTQRLLKSFKESMYPVRATKESLANELGITLQQVSKWFENTRWFFHHPRSMESQSSPSKGTNGSGELGAGNLVKSTLPEPRKKNGELGHQESDCSPSAGVAPTRNALVESPEDPKAMVESPEDPKARKSGRARNRRKSVT